ncbi:hypothetical protein [Streptomyces sp. NPDC008125]|uniref:hypothetical protein n=1 Tax=Streptomyces sp. NPDC008125 TaxID=3364811 RepID=UPI0036F04F5D
MARTPVTWYMATPADGIIELSRQAGTPVSLADRVGQVIDHPKPCALKWFDESGFSYFRMVKRVGEVLEDTSIWPVTWPVRLWVVEPLGETGNWSQHHYPYRLLAHRIRVVEETDPWPALGVRGREVLDVIQQQIPQRATEWAADWDADPDGMRERRRTWHRSGTRDICSGERARSTATAISRARRESAAQQWAENLAGDTAEHALDGADISRDAFYYACARAADLATATQHEARLDPYVLDALRGVRLDSVAVGA